MIYFAKEIYAKISQDVRNFIYDYRRFHGKKEKVLKTDIHNSEMQSRTAFKERFLFCEVKVSVKEIPPTIR